MTDARDNTTVGAEPDALHVKASAGYRAKDLSAFMDVFAPNLKYKQPDGRTIGREQLARDVGPQLSSLEAADTSYVRESLEVDGNRATEVLTQTASLTVRRFIFFKHTWHITRRGRYVWVRQPSGWKVEEVEVRSERVGRGAA